MTRTPRSPLSRAWEEQQPAVQTVVDQRVNGLYTGLMPGNRTYYVYIMSNQSRTLYVGFTNDIKRRVQQHKSGIVEGFTTRYKIGSLVYVESFHDVWSAIAREKQIKRWSRDKKLRLIASQNPEWHDLSDGWYA